MSDWFRRSFGPWTAGLLPGATALLAFVLVEDAAAQRVPSKIAHIVERAIDDCKKAAASGAGNFQGMSNGLLVVRPTGEIELSFHAFEQTGAREEADLVALSATIVDTLRIPPEANLPSAGLIVAFVPYDRVAEAAELPWVAAVTPPSYGVTNPHPVNPINSEGVPLHDADIAQAQGITGAGVTVGIISNGVASLAQAQAQNELPAVTVFNSGGGDEGTAMLEIVHDMAPGATLLYDDGSGTAPTRDVRHVNALFNLLANGANVITEDLAFDSQPAFQQGLVAAGREAVAALGASVHSSSGNRGTDHAARVFAVGTGGGPDGVSFGATPPGCSFTPDNVVAIAPSGDTTFDLPLGNGSFTLQWSEPRAIFPTPGGGGFTDLNLYVMDDALTQCLGESVGVQAFGLGDTIEQISINMPGVDAKIVVDVQSSTAAAVPLLDLRWRGMMPEDDATTRAGSNDPDKNYTGLAYSIGAVDTAGNLVGFSSAGPVTLFSSTICPGGAVGFCMGVPGPAAQVFQGLDFLGANNVSVSGVGGFGAGTCPAVNPGDCRFSGTSAAAPHTAACDVLVREILGAAAPLNDVRARLAATAIDFFPPGEDSTTGAGRLDCFQALGPPDASCQDVIVPTDPGVCTAAVASIDDGSFDTFDPNGMPSVSLSQSPAAPYPLGHSLVDLTATDADGLFDECVGSVTVVDQEAPQITCPADVVQPNDPGLCSAVVVYPDPVVMDNCPGATTSCLPPAGSVFDVGASDVNCTATDGAAIEDSCQFSITVEDVEPPVIESVTASPSVLWPPNHKMANVSVDVEVMDNCDVTACSIVNVTSNEAMNGRGDGNTSSDIQITGPLTVSLRAERSGRGSGRAYTIEVECVDEAGNAAQDSVIVPVPHDRRKKK